MKNLKLVIIIVAAVLAVIVFGIFAVQGFQNTAISLEEQVETAASDIRVQEKRRIDLVYNLADCVKQYDAHEANTLKDIVEGRASSSSMDDVQMAIAAVSEAYPELKSNENYKELMNELSITENLIAEYRSNYNAQVPSPIRLDSTRIRPLTRLITIFYPKIGESCSGYFGFP